MSAGWVCGFVVCGGGCGGGRSLALCPDGPLRFLVPLGLRLLWWVAALWCRVAPLACMTWGFRLAHLAPGCVGLERPFCVDSACVPFLRPFVRPDASQPMALEGFVCSSCEGMASTPVEAGNKSFAAALSPRP